MLRITLFFIYIAICVGAILAFVKTVPDDHPVKEHELLTFIIMMVVAQIVPLTDALFKRKNIAAISAIYFGILIGVLLAYLLNLALDPILVNFAFGGSVTVLTALMLPYLCVSLLLQTKDDFRFVIPYVEFAREVKGGKPLILDSSALIDGRIADVVETRIIDTQLIVPDFILKEIQDIADSNDKNRRTRGRRGLDVLSKLQNSTTAEVSVHETEDSEFKGLSVDQQLVALAKMIGGSVVTNDFNLNKVAGVQGVDVVNLNDVANSLKPRYLPGEPIRIKIIKEGESQSQGVGYLDDGTMVVCEQAANLIGKEVDTVVTSMLQSSAGRMIFARLANSSGK